MPNPSSRIPSHELESLKPVIVPPRHFACLAGHITISHPGSQLHLLSTAPSMSL